MQINDYIQSRLSLLPVDDTNVKNTEGTNSGSLNFMDVLKDKLNEVNDKQIAADTATEGFIKGDENIDIQDVMLSTEEAKMSLEMAVQMRNKLVDAYQELTRMQL